MWVRELESGVVVEIEESEFDATQHEKVEVRAASDEPARDDSPPTVGDLTPEQFGEVIVRSLAEANRQTTVSRERLAVRPGGGGEAPRGEEREQRDGVKAALEGIRANPAVMARYNSLPEWERKVRSPEGDAIAAAWIGAMSRGDREEASRIYLSCPQSNPNGRAASTLIQVDGLVPVPLASLIMVKREKFEAVGPRAQLFSSPNTSLRVPTEGVKMATNTVAENVDHLAGETQVTWTDVTLTKVKGIASARLTRESVEDSAFSIATQLSNQAAQAMAAYNDAQDCVGPDFTAPLNGASVVNSTIEALTRGRVTELIFSVGAQYRIGAALYGNNNMINWLSDLEDLNGRPIYQNALNPAAVLDGGQGQPATGVVEGFPLVEAPFIDGTLFFGNLQFGYASLQDSMMRAEATTEGGDAWENDLVAWKFVQRRDGAIVVGEALSQSTAMTAPA